MKHKYSLNLLIYGRYCAQQQQYNIDAQFQKYFFCLIFNKYIDELYLSYVKQV